MENNCLICLDLTLTYCLINCGCKIYVHKECLEKWIKNKNSCIICKKKINLTSRTLKLRWKYFTDFFEKSQLIKANELIIDYTIKYIKNKSDSINKFMLLNILFSIGILIILFPTILYIAIISQIKYYSDVWSGKIIPSYKMVKISSSSNVSFRN